MRAPPPAPARASAPGRAAAAARPAPRHFIATYHYIREQDSDGVTALRPHEFAAQVRAIAQRYRVVSVDEFIARQSHESGLALLTFDDALRDQRTAADILDRLRLPAVFFAPMRPFAEPDPAQRWCTQHLLHALAEQLGWAEFSRRVAPFLEGLPLDAAEIDRLYHYEVPHKRRVKYAFAFALSAAAAAEALHSVNAAIGLAAADWFLTPADLAALQATGHALGGHGYDHLPYSTLTPAAQHADLRRAADALNRLAGPRPRALAYPFGRSTPETAALARACGYTHAFGTAERVDAKFVMPTLGAADVP